MSNSVRSALYYPHTGVRTIDMLKSGLLLWDTVEYIGPDEYTTPSRPTDTSPDDIEYVEEASYCSFDMCRQTMSGNGPTKQ